MSDTGLSFYESQPPEIKKLLLTPGEIREITYYKNTWDETLPYSILVRQIEKIETVRGR